MENWKMNIQEYLNVKKDFQRIFLSLLSEDQPNDKLDLTEFTKCINDQNIRNDANEFRSFLDFVKKISNFFCRSSNFFNIIETILLSFKEEFQKYLTNAEIYNIFATNKRIVLFLLENKILYMNNIIADSIIRFPGQDCYFYNEIKPFISKQNIEKIEKEIKNIDQDPEIFEQNRKIGENENHIYQLIRNDSIDDFVIYTNRKNFSLKTIIKPSIFESNIFLIDNEPNLIEYAAFYGSIQIFNYLRLNKVELRPILWLYSIHGRNAEIIHLLEEYKVEPPDNSYEKCFEESIKCHHNDIAEYIENKFLNSNSIKKNESIKTGIIISLNYEYFPDDFTDSSAFFDLCRFGHFKLVEYMLNTKKFDVDSIKQIQMKSNSILCSPLFVSIKNDYINIFELLINRQDVDVNNIGIITDWKTNEKTRDSLTFAIWNDNYKIVQTLLNHPKISINAKLYYKKYIDNNNNNSVFIMEQSAFMEAIDPPNLNIIKLFLSHQNFDVNMTYKYYYLKESNINTNTNKTDIIEITSPLHKAIMNGYIDVVKLLLAHPKIDVNIRSYNSLSFNIFYDDSLLTCSIREKQNEIVELLLKHPKIDVNSKCIIDTRSNFLLEEKTALYLAVENENESLVKLLLDNPEIDVNCKYYYRKSVHSKIKYIPVLHKAIKIGNKNIVKLLLSNPKIDVNILSTSKSIHVNRIVEKVKTTLDFAIKNGNVEILNILLSNDKIDLNLKSKKVTMSQHLISEEKKSPLEIALSQENVEIFQVIFDFFIKKEKPSIEYLRQISISDFGINEKIQSIILQYIQEKVDD